MRTRLELDDVVAVSTLAASGAGAAAQAVPGGAPPPSQASPQARGKALEEKLVVEGWLGLDVDDVPGTVAAIRAQAVAAGGRVVREEVSGGARSWSGSLEVKLPPGGVSSFLDWLQKQGNVRDKRIQATDVSRTLFDHQIALDTYEQTLARLRKLLERDGLDMKDILAIENEMTRLRGEIERIKGEKRFLEHRVALATLNISVRRREGAVLGAASAKLYPGPRLSALMLLDPGERERLRLGGGVAIHTLPRLTLELDVFQGPGGESAAVLLTFGGSIYSDFLGRGRRRFLNPFLGTRIGYGYLQGSSFVFGGGGGVELFKHKYVLVDTSMNVLGFAGESFEAAVVGSASVVVAF
jgi:hypothetical protein